MLTSLPAEIHNPLMKISNFQVPRQIIFGLGAAERTGTIARELGGQKVLLVTDQTLTKIGLIDSLRSTLEKKGLTVDVFDRILGEPELDTAEVVVEYVRKCNCNLVIGVGGGSSLDIAKVASVMATNSGSVKQYLGVNLVKKTGIPKILIPTTSGTGSEVSASAALGEPEREIKRAIFSPQLFADVAIVDPLLAVTMPPMVTASTGFDALSHALESFISTNRNPIIDPLALEAIRLVAGNLRVAFADGLNLEARCNMSLAALLGGMCHSLNAGVNGGHAASAAFSVKYKIPHGVGVAVALPYVLEYNLMACMDRLAVVAKTMGEDISLPMREAASKAVASVKKLVADLNLPQRLQDLNIPREAIPQLVEGMLARTELLAKNPRKMTREDALKLFERMWIGN